MILQTDFVKLKDYLWEIPKSFRSDMRVPARIYASKRIFQGVEEEAINQLVNVASLPGIVKYAIAMPDIHSGYGFPIGGVAATKYPDGIISPGGVGYDISCAVRLLKSQYSQKEIGSYLERIAAELQSAVPSGLGKGGKIKLSIRQIDEILENGAQKLVECGYGQEDDIKNCEEAGRLECADASAVSEHAKNRGRDQVGTLGSGNHFLEVQKVAEIFDKETAEKFGLFQNQITIMIHCGSSGAGHQIATDYIRVMMQAMPKYGISLKDKELAGAPFNSPEGQRYFRAMCAGANYSWANRQMITYFIRKAWKKILANDKLSLLYDVAHNIAKIEEHEINGRKMKLIVHRKGATRAFPPGYPELGGKYKKTGQPVLVPGSMGTASYVLVGTKKAKEAFYTVNHGAGRTMSRHQATRKVRPDKLMKNLKERGVIIKCRTMRGIAEEAPIAYKNIEEVIEIVHNAGLAKKVAKLLPLAVIKGD